MTLTTMNSFNLRYISKDLISEYSYGAMTLAYEFEAGYESPCNRVWGRLLEYVAFADLRPD